MKTLTKILLAVSILATLGLGGLAQSVNAQPKRTVVVKHRHHASIHTLASAPQGKQKHHAVTSSNKRTNENEANESPNDSDSAHEDAR